MNRSAAITRALTLHPDVPGAGRLCQELLADVTGQPITRESPPLLTETGDIAPSVNRWGCKGKPK